MYYIYSFTVAPNITISPVTQTVESSSNVTFVCAASSKPRATIQWTKNENKLTNSFKIMITNYTEGRCTITDPPDQCIISSTLEIFYTEPPDSGTITCNATNEAGYSKKSVILSVDGMCKRFYGIASNLYDDAKKLRIVNYVFTYMAALSAL